MGWCSRHWLSIHRLREGANPDAGEHSLVIQHSAIWTLSKLNSLSIYRVSRFDFPLSYFPGFFLGTDGNSPTSSHTPPAPINLRSDSGHVIWGRHICRSLARWFVNSLTAYPQREFWKTNTPLCTFLRYLKIFTKCANSGKQCNFWYDDF